MEVPKEQHGATKRERINEDFFKSFKRILLLSIWAKAFD